MNNSEQHDFDIDVDVSNLLQVRPDEATHPSVYVDSRWYEMANHPQNRSKLLCEKIDRLFDNALWQAQWKASLAERERRHFARAPLLSRVKTQFTQFTTIDVSAGGLRCAGRPVRGRMEIEFKIPTLAFPISARTEVTSVKESSVLPWCGLRFSDIDPVYEEAIRKYVGQRRTQTALAA